MSGPGLGHRHGAIINILKGETAPRLVMNQNQMQGVPQHVGRWVEKMRACEVEYGRFAHLPPQSPLWVYVQVDSLRMLSQRVSQLPRPAF